MLVETEKSPAVHAIQLVVVVTVMMWLIEVVDVVILDHGLDRQGIVPRSLGGLDGVLWAPWLHGGFGHLLANSLPFIVLGWFVALGGVRRWILVTVFVTIVGGVATWLLARPAVHLGASGLIFGYAGFLLVAGVVERSLRGVLIAVVVGALFGGMVIRGIIPAASWISWESHLFGLMAGVLAAFVLATPKSEQVGQTA